MSSSENATLFDAKRRFRPVIASPFYEVKAYSPYIVSLITAIKVFHELKLDWDYYELSGDSYVDRAKNELVHRFLKSDYTHLMMIDSDLAWDLEGFVRIIKAAMLGAEVVGGAFPNKNNWSSFGVTPILVNGQPSYKEVGGLKLIEAWGIPGGFIIYSRKAFERTQSNLNRYNDPRHNSKLIEYFKILIQENKYSPEEDNYEKYIRDSFDRALADFGEYAGMDMNQKFLECFRCSIEKNGGRIGEDIYFQQRYREMGGTIWLEPNIWFRHYGVKAWEGNYFESLKEIPFKSKPKSDKPLVSVVIPCFNYAHYLDEAIRSVLGQTYENVEIIVVNDGSTDDSAEVAAKYQVTLVNQENGGLSCARNKGISKANGDFIVCLDADDMLSPEYIQKCLDVKGYDLVGTGMKLFGDVNTEVFFQDSPEILDMADCNQIHCSAMFPKKMWEVLGGFDENMKGGFEDWDLWMRAIKKGYKAKNIHEPLLFYRKHGITMLNDAMKKQTEIHQYIMDKLNKMEG